MPDNSIEQLRTSLRELRNDLALNTKSVKGVTDAGDLSRHLQESVWPFFEAVIDAIDLHVDATDEIEDGLLELASEEADLITPDTGTKLLNVFVIATAVAEALEQRLTADEGDLKGRLADFKKALVEIKDIVTDSIVGDPEGDDEQGDDEEEGDE